MVQDAALQTVPTIKHSSCKAQENHAKHRHLCTQADNSNKTGGGGMQEKAERAQGVGGAARPRVKLNGLLVSCPVLVPHLSSMFGSWMKMMSMRGVDLLMNSR